MAKQWFVKSKVSFFRRWNTGIAKSTGSAGTASGQADHSPRPPHSSWLLVSMSEPPPMLEQRLADWRRARRQLLQPTPPYLLWDGR
jgi:hypothetical protein